MLASTSKSSPVVATYVNGQPYSAPRGRYAPREAVIDRLAPTAAVVDLDRTQPTAPDFVQAITRKMKIRFYRPKSIRNYCTALRSLLPSYDGPPHRVSREDVRDYLLFLVDAGASSSWVSVNLSAIRTAFDKMCGRSITLGLASPRRPKRLPREPNDL